MQILLKICPPPPGAVSWFWRRIRNRFFG